MADMTRVGMSVRGAEVVTVPIDDTLTIEGQAADAKATGDALALKADKSELQAAVKVNNQPADAQGLILIDGRHIPVSDEDAETLAEAVTDLKEQTAENIPMSSDSGAKTIAEVVNANAEAIESMEEMTGATMPIESGSQTTVKAAIEARVKTVNRKAPDADGDVDLSVVPLAENLQSDKMESVEGAFIIRTTGGNASVSDGKAYPLHLFGAAEHTGYVAEELNMTVIPITRTEPDEPITATIDRDTFVAYVDESSTINLYYTTEWSADPELYGITVTGTPVAGDQITVVYVKEVRGTITVANPARMVGTGWNLFDYNNGYARVVKYSTEYGYKIGGSYASIQFSATLTGERSSITPGVDGLFNVPSDGYVFVTGGNNTDTYILTTWSDWMEGPSSGYWEPYRESGIDLSTVMTTYFPNGLLAVGTTSDEIDLSAKRSISRIERMAYSEENRAAAAASGRSYDFDQNYIYIVRESAVISAITIDTTYNVSEHGLEWFTETTLPVISEILYGKNLRDKLERDVVTISAQTLTEEEKAQVRTNIGAMSQADGDKKLVAPTTAGTNGQLLQTNGDGTTKWTTQGTPTDAQVGTAVSAWLTAHPEATTTVQDGAISRAKLNDDLKAKTDAVSDLKSAMSEVNDMLSNETGEINYLFTDYGWIPTTTEEVNPANVVSDGTHSCCVIPCDADDVFAIKASGVNSSHRPWSFIDEDNAVIKQAGTNTVDITLIAPVGAKKLVLNTGKNVDHYCIKKSSKISRLEKTAENYKKEKGYLPIDWIQGFMTSSGDGPQNRDYFIKTDYIDVTGMKMLQIHRDISIAVVAYCYDEEKTYISPSYDFYGDTTGSLIPNDGTKYIRLRATINLETQINTSYGDYIQIEKNNNQIPYVTPQMFGAVGDGVTDDTSAFQKAINSGYPLYVPSAHGEKYRITNTLQINAGGSSKIYGDVIFPKQNISCIFLDLSGSGLDVDGMRNVALFDVNNFQQLSISGLMFTCPGQSDKRVGYFIDATGSTCDYDIHITNCHFTSFYRFVKFKGRGFNVINCSLASMNYIGVFDWVDEEDTNPNHPAEYDQRAIRFQNNRLHRMHSGNIYIHSGHAYGFVFSGNVMDNGSGYLVIAEEKGFNWHISGNTYQGVTLDGPIIWAKDGMRNCLINDNLFSADIGYWQTLEGVSTVIPPTNWILAGGTVEYCNITGNNFKNSQFSAIELNDASHNIIANNIMQAIGTVAENNPEDSETEGGGESGETLAAISINGDANRNNIVGNNATGRNVNIVLLSYEEGSTVTGDVLYANIPAE